MEKRTGKFKDNDFGRRVKDGLCKAVVNTFEGQLTVLLVIIVVDIFTPIVHREELKEADVRVPLLMVEVMSDQSGGFQQLHKAFIGEQRQGKQQV